MAKGEIAQWKIKEGDSVKKGDIIATIETMKGLIDMEVFDDGVITKLLVNQGEEIQVGVPIAEIELATDPQAVDPNLNDVIPHNLHAPELANAHDKTLNKAPSPNEPQKGAQSHSHAPQPQVRSNSKNAGNTPKPKISPAARAKAQQEGIDWHHIKPSNGPESAILLADIVKLAENTPTSPPTDQQQTHENELSPMQQAIAAVVSQSKREIPHYYLQQDICLDQAQAWLSAHNQSLAVADRILVNALIYCAIAKALGAFTQFNGFFNKGEYQAKEAVHLGNVINLRQGGLMVAAIHDAEALNPVTMMSKIKDQVIRAKKGELRMSEMQDATITVSNIGERGVDSIQSIILPPQVAIIGVGRVRVSPWVVDEKVVTANIVTLSLAADHRVSDGHSGARLLNKIDSLLQKPKALT